MNIDVAELVNSNGADFNITMLISKGYCQLRHVVLISIEHGTDWDLKDEPVVIIPQIVRAILFK